ncbi:hypothetical protein C8R47DRAFT_1065316 [Mycena vitilis]|nr:hypothetical protein C8R47DRAFT_1065316 [Mycena vitilis]
MSIMRVPLDIVFLILRLLPLPDAFAVFMRQGRIDYSGVTNAALQARVMKARRVFNSWRTQSVKPKIVCWMPLDQRARQLLLIPGTTLFVVEETYDLRLCDWKSGAVCTVPLERSNASPVSLKVVWVQSVRRNVLVVASSYGTIGSRPRPVVLSEINIFVVDACGPSVNYIATARFADQVMGYSLSEDHLAVVGCSRLGAKRYFIHSLGVVYHSLCDDLGSAKRTYSRHCHRIRWGFMVEPQGNLAASSFAILDDTHFLLANPSGIAVFKLSADVPTTEPVKACWRRRYMSRDVLPRPLLTPASADCVNGRISMSICSRNFLRHFSMTIEDNPRFTLSERPLFTRPAYLSVTGACHVGVYRRHYSAGFTTFALTDTDLHPFAAAATSEVGSVVHRLDEGDAIQPSSISMDEGAGRIAFLQLTPRILGGEAARVVVLELA